ncbi:TM2 domain-containing protein [Lactiplantibacillus carotarum]|uniref:TM2 domain-containing protein n=1 Tax=Lactiplantibacillus carotarum TaxID=2993456 RepID=UPI00298F2627|nr:TM2 domain-containing protein [Lactiplantibacillus carotarum]
MLKTTTHDQSLTEQERRLVDTKVADQVKSPVVAYLFWLFFGLLGGHRYYFNKSRSAIAMTTLLFVLGGLTLGLIISLFWMLIDGFLILQWLAHDRANVERQAVTQLLARRTWR